MVVRCPEVCAAAPEDRDAARAFERVVAAVTDLCPLVEVTEPGVCAFAARGPARYFGGETIVARKIIAAARDIGVACRVGVAEGLRAAQLAAMSAGQEPELTGQGPEITVVPPGGTREFLAGLDVSVLDGADLAQLLRRLGVRTLGDLAALPATDVASRFGAIGEAAHRLARGADERPLAASPPAEDLSVVAEFDPPQTLAEPLVFAGKTLAEELFQTLNRKGLTCARVMVQARWADGRESSRLWRHDGLLTTVQLADRVRWQLDGWQAGAPAVSDVVGRGADEEYGGGVTLLRLAPDQVVRAGGLQLALWGEAVITDRVARAAMRLQAMLGHEAVLRPLPSGGRNAADHVTQTPLWDKEEPKFPVDQPWPGRIPGPAPAVVYQGRARAATVTGDDGRIVTVSGRCAVSAPPATLTVEGEPPRAITGWTGPWPLTERWWDDEASSRKARFQFVTDDGRAWLASVRDGRWQIEAGYW